MSDVKQPQPHLGQRTLRDRASRDRDRARRDGVDAVKGERRPGKFRLNALEWLVLVAIVAWAAYTFFAR